MRFTVGTSLLQLAPEQAVAETIRALQQSSETTPTSLRHKIAMRSGFVDVVTSAFFVLSLPRGQEADEGRQTSSRIERTPVALSTMRRALPTLRSCASASLRPPSLRLISVVVQRPNEPLRERDGQATHRPLPHLPSLRLRVFARQRSRLARRLCSPHSLSRRLRQRLDGLCRLLLRHPEHVQDACGSLDPFGQPLRRARHDARDELAV